MDMNNANKKISGGAGHENSSREELEKEKREIEGQLKKYAAKNPDFGDDTESDFEEEADEAEEYSQNLGVEQALKERLSEIESALRKLNSKSAPKK